MFPSLKKKRKKFQYLIENMKLGKFCFGVEVNNESSHALYLISIYLMLNRNSQLKSDL